MYYPTSSPSGSKKRYISLRFRWNKNRDWFAVSRMPWVIGSPPKPVLYGDMAIGLTEKKSLGVEGPS
jgi:hypothetical protein